MRSATAHTSRPANRPRNGMFGAVALVSRLRDAILRLNPAIPDDAREEALRKVLRIGTSFLTQTNRAFPRMLRDTLLPKLLSGELSVTEMATAA